MDPEHQCTQALSRPNTGRAVLTGDKQLAADPGPGAEPVRHGARRQGDECPDQCHLGDLGSSLGVALAGTVLIIGLAQQLNTALANSEVISPQLQQATRDATASGVQVVPGSRLMQLMKEAALPEEQADALLQDYNSSKLQALRRGLGIVLIDGLLALPLTRALPDRPLQS